MPRARLKLGCILQVSVPSSCFCFGQQFWHVWSTHPVTGGYLTGVHFRVTVNIHNYLCMPGFIHIVWPPLHEIFFSVQDDNEPKLTETEKKKLSLQETRRSLPIFPFRDDLIQAIKDHQVSHPDSNKILRFITTVNSCTSVCLLKLLVIQYT
jgi:hypothetical protein